MRLVPNTDTVPASVNRFLLPHERQVITVHQHPAILIKPIFWVLIGLAIAGWLSNSVAHGNGTAILIIWILWGVLFAKPGGEGLGVGGNLLRRHLPAVRARERAS